MTWHIFDEVRPGYWHDGTALYRKYRGTVPAPRPPDLGLMLLETLGEEIAVGLTDNTFEAVATPEGPMSDNFTQSGDGFWYATEGEDFPFQGIVLNLEDVPDV